MRGAAHHHFPRLQGSRFGAASTFDDLRCLSRRLSPGAGTRWVGAPPFPATHRGVGGRTPESPLRCLPRDCGQMTCLRTSGTSRLQVLEDNVHPAQLDRRAYARFCRRFEDSATSFLGSFRKRPLTHSFAVLCNDICEGVDFKRVAAMGIPVTTIFHVDVADFFSRMYLGSNGPPVKLVKFFRWVSKTHLSGICPDVLRLVFEKQADCLRHSSRIVVPSDGMVQTIAQCYGKKMVEKTAVVPWGGWEEPLSASVVEQEMKKAIREFDLSGGNHRTADNEPHISRERPRASPEGSPALGGESRRREIKRNRRNRRTSSGPHLRERGVYER